MKLSASKPLLFHILKPQTPKPLFFLTHHHYLCTNPNEAEDSLITQVLHLLQPNVQHWNLPQLHTLLFPNSTSTSPSPRSLFHIARRLAAPSKALSFFDFVSQSHERSNALGSLSSSFQALLELTLRHPTSEKSPFELYNMAKDRNVPISLKAAVLLVRSLGMAGMKEEAIVVFNELDSELKTMYIRNVVIRMLLEMGRVDDALKVLDEMLDPEAKFRVDDFTVDVVIGLLLRREKIGRSVSEEEMVESLVCFLIVCGL